MLQALLSALDMHADTFQLVCRGAKQQPVWGRAYTALTGVYFDRRDPGITAAFNEVLGPRTIGEQKRASARNSSG